MAEEFPIEFSQSGGKVSNEASAANLIAGGGGNGIRYFRDDALFKLLNNGNKILADLGHQTIMELLEFNKHIGKIIPHLCAQQTSKNHLVRLRLAQYIEKVILHSEKDVLESNCDLIDQFLLQSNEDQSQDVRQAARKCFSSYRAVMHERSTMLLMHGIKSSMIKKQMAAEIGVELSQLAKEITYFEQEERSPLLERGEDQAYKSPIKERMKMI